MRVLENIGFSKSSELTIEYFEKLPKRAKEMIANIVSYLVVHKPEDLYIIDVVDIIGDYDVTSPIEKIFEIACNIIFELRKDEISDYYIESEHQKEIICGKKKYYADFFFYVMNGEDEATFKKLVVECDGHDFHKLTKAQVKHDNEREFDIKMAGYDVLRFSGSQIYENPIKCANDTFDYMLNIINKECD